MNISLLCAYWPVTQDTIFNDVSNINKSEATQRLGYKSSLNSINQRLVYKVIPLNSINKGYTKACLNVTSLRSIKQRPNIDLLQVTSLKLINQRPNTDLLQVKSLKPYLKGIEYNVLTLYKDMVRSEVYQAKILKV